MVEHLELLCSWLYENVLVVIHQSHDVFWNGNACFLIAYVVSLTILFNSKEKTNGKRLLATFSVFILLGVCYNPYASIMFNHFPQSNDGVYGRIWILLPVWIVIAFAGVELIGRIKSTAYRNISIICFAVGVVIAGTSPDMLTQYNQSLSPYKVNPDGVEIADKVLSNNNGNPAGLLMLLNDNERNDNYIQGGTAYYGIQQYTSKIEVFPVYFNDQTWNEIFTSEVLPDGETATKLFFNDSFAYYRRSYDFNYVLIPHDESFDEKMAYSGYQYVASINNYDLYEAVPRWKIQSYSNYLGDGEAIYLISDNMGHFVVVGGGSSSSSSQIQNILAFCGNHVDAWIMTSPSANNLEGFNSVIQSGNCEVDRVYLPAMKNDIVSSEYMNEKDYYAYEEFLNLSEMGLFEHIFVTEGETIELYGMDVTILSDLLNVQTGSVTDNSMLMRMEIGEKSFLFCSYIGYEQGQLALQKYGNSLDSDYIQIASGSGSSLGLEFYKTVSPDIALCDYLDEGDGLDTYNMLISLGVDCYCVENGDKSWIIIE